MRTGVPTVNSKGRSLRSFALPSLAAAVVVFTLIPLLYLLVRASEKPFPEIMDLLLREKTLEVIGRTVSLVLLVVLIDIVVGTILANGLFFVRLPFARYLVIPAILPLAIPSYVFTYTWLAVLPSLSGFWFLQLCHM